MTNKRIQELRKEQSSYKKDLEILMRFKKENFFNDCEFRYAWLQDQVKKAEYEAAKVAQLIFNTERELMFTEEAN